MAWIHDGEAENVFLQDRKMSADWISAVKDIIVCADKLYVSQRHTGLLLKARKRAAKEHDG